MAKIANLKNSRLGEKTVQEGLREGISFYPKTPGNIHPYQP